jgi:hypothetical protein
MAQHVDFPSVKSLNGSKYSAWRTLYWAKHKKTNATLRLSLLRARVPRVPHQTTRKNQASGWLGLEKPSCFCSSALRKIINRSSECHGRARIGAFLFLFFRVGNHLMSRQCGTVIHNFSFYLEFMGSLFVKYSPRSRFTVLSPWAW